MKVLAPAKINLFLSVGARTPGGLHELVSVMQCVSLSDTLTVSVASGFSLDVTPPGSAPADDNLVARAAGAFCSMQGVEPAFAFELTKTIPMAAGLGGGSADAAATLVGLNDALGAAVSRKGLEKIGASLGSDVPFCVRGGTAFVTGVGDELSPVVCAQPLWWVLGVSGAALSTADVYAEFDRLGGGTLGDPHEVADTLARGDIARLGSALRNDLEAPAVALMPALGSGRAALERAGALGVVLAGSGPTWCGLARDEAHARALAADCAGVFARVEVVESLTHGARVIER